MSMQSMQKAILMDVIHPRMNKVQSEERLRELESLVTTYGGIVIVKRHQRRFRPHPRTYIGPGKIQMLAEEGKELGASIVIVNHTLKPRQLFAIGEELRKHKIQVWDRIDLILKIFDKHAETTEAKLEIELASIRHMGPRIFGMGLELLRQAGGIGTRGIGETNTEIMKRHLAARERKIKEKLKKYHRVRAEHRKGRTRRGLKTVALVGYTNAGKTTLLNRLTGRKEYAADELFATLDTRVGKIYMTPSGPASSAGLGDAVSPASARFAARLPGSPPAAVPMQGKEVLVSDTIGFIQHLPPELLNAFAATLSEAVHADLLLHVIDSADERMEDQFRVVESILERLGVSDHKRLLVLNKMDEAPEGAVELMSRLNVDELPMVSVSAHTGEGIDALKTNIAQLL